MLGLRRAVPVAAIMLMSFALPAVAAPTHEAIVVHLQHAPSAGQSLHLSFHAKPLPHGGYYYGVIVLRPYKRYTAKAPPPCATSSNMLRTDYGYPKDGGTVTLTLTRAPSPAARWCRGGNYLGAIYAVPQSPPCDAEYPCRAEPYGGSPCFELEDGHRACGIVARPPRYRYPSGLPRPLAPGTKIVSRFSVVFR